MSRFAAIEARATQYPADTNDVVWLVERVRQLRDALQQAIDGTQYGESWYYEARTALAALNKPNVPLSS